MIKFHSEKQEQMMREIKEFTKDVYTFIGHSSQEMSFFQDVLANISKLCFDFAKKFDGLIGSIAAKTEQVFLNFPDRLAPEKKHHYNSLLTYSLKALEQNLLSVRQRFGTDVMETVIRAEADFKAFLKVDLVNLGTENTRLCNDITILEKDRLGYRKKKEEFFDYFNQFKLEELVRIKNRSDLSTPSLLISLREAPGTPAPVLPAVLPDQPELFDPEPDPPQHLPALRGHHPPQVPSPVG